MSISSLRFIDEEIIQVLLIEDNLDHSRLISLILERSVSPKFEVDFAVSLREAIDKLKEKQYAIALLDLTLPESAGLPTFFSLHARIPDTPIVVLSGTDDEYIAVEAVRGGAQDYLVKGTADSNLILRAIRYALERKRAAEVLRKSEEHFRSLIENSSDVIAQIDPGGNINYASQSHERVLGYQPADLLGKSFFQFVHPDDANLVQNAIDKSKSKDKVESKLDFRLKHFDGSWHVFEGYFTISVDHYDNQTTVVNSHDITERVQNQIELANAYDATLEGWGHALELRDNEIEGHSKRVTEMTLKLARAMGISEEQLVHVRRGSLLHDIGKMGIPDNILLKNNELSEEEWLIMRKHPEYAYDMLKPIEYLSLALDIPYCHHEKWDGTGYPKGLKGEEIPLAARIFSVIDVYDALISARPYSEPWSTEKAKKHIQSLAGKHFDPAVVNQFLEIF